MRRLVLFKTWPWCPTAFAQLHGPCSMFLGLRQRWLFLRHEAHWCQSMIKKITKRCLDLALQLAKVSSGLQALATSLSWFIKGSKSLQRSSTKTPIACSRVSCRPSTQKGTFCIKSWQHVGGREKSPFKSIDTTTLFRWDLFEYQNMSSASEWYADLCAEGHVQSLTSPKD